MAKDAAASTEDLHALLEEHGDAPTQRLVTALLVNHGVSKRTIADSLDQSLKTIYNWLDRFDVEPLEEAPFDQPRPGAPPSLKPDQEQQLFETLQIPPTESEYDAPAWTPALVRDHIRSAFGVEYSRRHVRRLMHDAGLSYRAAQPQRHEANSRVKAASEEGFEKRHGRWVASE